MFNDDEYWDLDFFFHYSSLHWIVVWEWSREIFFKSGKKTVENNNIPFSKKPLLTNQTGINSTPSNEWWDNFLNIVSLLYDGSMICQTYLWILISETLIFPRIEVFIFAFTVVPDTLCCIYDILTWSVF